jgi:ribosome maturation factor RimP
VSRDLGAALDVEDIIPHAYRLEVSSPGLDRELKMPEHFVRFTGSMVKVKTYQLINGEKVFHGTLRGVDGGTVVIELEAGNILHIALSDIAKASLEVEF